MTRAVDSTPNSDRGRVPSLARSKAATISTSVGPRPAPKWHQAANSSERNRPYREVPAHLWIIAIHSHPHASMHAHPHARIRARLHARLHARPPARLHARTGGWAGGRVGGRAGGRAGGRRVCLAMVPHHPCTSLHMVSHMSSRGPLHMSVQTSVHKSVRVSIHVGLPVCKVQMHMSIHMPVAHGVHGDPIRTCTVSVHTFTWIS